MKRTTDSDKLLAEHRADPGAAVRGLTQLFLCAANLANPIADHTGQPEWRALVTEIEGMLVRLDAMDAGYAVAARCATVTVVEPGSAIVPLSASADVKLTAIVLGA